ncbi:putative ADP-ribosylation factor-like putativesmall GTPase [Leptomonas pyrrhocoris]|uniref:ADP-ribosylation factor-like protein 6 n=1 Tax=Leptomonas pyrrhocoris TaxID=157538 RepID=A0A0M9FXC3_LEPPY|nr:putative ADP-ribosylation factor-like putativesmall GTPase [Leptomonas pyrrhocoris]XP_015656480.1 putative ADP-ribosylation factor-like putativesmall GTPase [Leptomonas pyrrhocoris]XP_015656481.1 putative ADP-ribosylation factor-like putativesmall GTPase [Leptomonas pyrrhocoris]KPA78040.1 putative ADP-ribosylation factor-like putativesmall GTPase [Leptomonas pyrrhocoris]KPA78041.1 putative ADP-ribosylation factor-like putativesmall GTPase [Leptomonas pyrrhocoris]KPA78042.1 putative ADP-ribo|eukprot:XP_015656479.1 putative ADP-ribosylation factor-like putativesmall GTPase [Leptomonas pyrrhocoris]
MGQAKTKLNIIVCGLDNSGKTTIINYMKPEDQRTENIAATVGYNVDKFKKGKIEFTAFDMGGAQKFRGLWESYYSNIDGVVFVVDSTDHLRLCVVKDELQLMLHHADLKNTAVPFLFFANKMDLPGAKTPMELTQIVELNSIMGDHPMNIFASNALKGEGIDDGLQWLQSAMLRQREQSKKK